MTKIVYVSVHPPVTVIGFDDGTTSVAWLGDNDTYDEKTGVLMALAKKLLGSYTNVDKALEMGKDSLRKYIEFKMSERQS